ncbi:MAG: UDP-2,3-diacylglucosamine hydrolase [Paraglaciecola sp.]
MFMTQLEFSAEARLAFASDFHLGAPNYSQSRDRETVINQWLEEVGRNADAIFLVGDVFDFWFEYKAVVPKGFIRFLGKLASLADQGIPIHIFHGNHDLWIKDYLTKEVGAIIHSDPITLVIGQKKMLVGHGDGLGPGDHTYKFLKKVFKNPVAKFLFHWLHPDIGVGLANRWSSNSRINNIKKGSEEHQGENEWLYQYALEQEKISHHDYYVFGHRHLPMEMKISENSSYINIGEWVNYKTYGLFEDSKLQLLTYES